MTRVHDPLGRPVEARWLVLPDGRAVVEAAAAIGLPLLARAERDPLRASSRGLGELLLAALADGPPGLVVALGGTATVDGGAGLREVVSELPVPTVALADVRTRARRRRACVRPSEGRLARRRRDPRAAARCARRASSVRRATGIRRRRRPRGGVRGPGRGARPGRLDGARPHRLRRGGRRWRTSSSRVRARSTRRRPPVRRRGRSHAVRQQQEFAASSSAGVSARRSPVSRRSRSRATPHARRKTSWPWDDAWPGKSPSATRRRRAGRPSPRGASTRPAGATRRTAGRRTPGGCTRLCRTSPSRSRCVACGR